MKKLLTFYFLNRIIKDPVMTATIYKVLYEGGDLPERTYSSVGGHIPNLPANTNMSKKDEVIASLEYLKSKEVKTKKDKEAIQMLEAVLNNL
jgi:hypothetical protein